MAKSAFEKSIDEVTEAFALQVVEIIKGATLQELIGLQMGDLPKKPGPKPGSKMRKKPGPKPGAKAAAAALDLTRPARRKRVVKNYPKCAYPGCNKNRFVRGKGFCGEHWRMFEAGQIKSAEEYKKSNPV